MNINNNKLKDVSDLESFNTKLKPTCRLQMVFSTETHVSMCIYLEIIKFLLYPDTCAMVAQWIECSALEPEHRVELQEGTFNFFLLLF